MYHASISIVVLYKLNITTMVKYLISFSPGHKGIEMHIKYRNKKWVTNSKGAPYE